VRELGVLTLPSDASAPRLARTWASQQLNPIGLDAITFENVMLGISELVTNVVRHTDSAPTLLIRLDDHQVCVEVSDSSGRIAAIRDQDPEEAGGWGLRIIDEIADRWGATYRSNGDKIVWFAIAA